MSALRELGIPLWVLRDGARTSEAATPAAVEPAPPPAVKAASQGDGAPALPAGADDWAGLAAAVRACTQCGLHRGRTQAVLGVGRTDAELLVIGEAPGAEEDRQGEPFVGPAGQLLNAMLGAFGFARRDVYIANILKCRPPHNRDPSQEEAATCTPFLDRQIALIKPRAILAVGRIAAQWLLQTDAPIGRLRGRVQQFREIPLVVTYHPAYLLRTPQAKSTAWQDLCMLKRMLTERS